MLGSLFFGGGEVGNGWLRCFSLCLLYWEVSELGPWGRTVFGAPQALTGEW